MFSLNLNCSDFVMMETSATESESSFLIDSQADISVIKQNAIYDNLHIDERNSIKIRGVTAGTIESLGTIQIELYTNEVSIEHEFHVVPNEFNIPSDGIIGRDFLKSQRCQINYHNMSITFSQNGDRITIPLHDGPSDDTLVLPARAEVFRIFNIARYEKPIFIPNQEIFPGIFMANTIANSKNPIIKIVNTTDEIKVIPKDIQKMENLSNYNIYTMNKTKTEPNRFEKLSETLKRNIPKQYIEIMMPLLRSYSDIFALPNDSMTQNNFYEQKLRLTDNQPVYVKNYRLPNSQKTEIKSQVEKLIKNDLIEPSQSPYSIDISAEKINRWHTQMANVC